MVMLIWEFNCNFVLNTIFGGLTWWILGSYR